MTILPFCCFPSAYWLHLASAEAVIDVHENYVKQSYRNRFDVAGVNGKITLTIPVEGQHGKKIPFHDIRIAPGSWQKQHVRSIKAAYGRAPFFEYFYPELEEILLHPGQTLLELNEQALAWIKLSGLTFNFQISEVYIETSSHDRDFRSKFEPSSSRPLLPEYPQVFSDRRSFMNDLSAVDLMMNLGTGLKDYLRSFQVEI
ncbi:MAG: WbqC family protein [Flavobacteriales bacterium]|nr:WbqC family protein [Flavobacteriales bacterium]